MPAGQIEAGAVRLRYELAGPDALPVLLLHHCFGADLDYWDRHLAAFKGFRTLRFDARGHGGSALPTGPHTLAAMADDVAALLDALNIEAVHYCGVSIGGQVGQTFALAYPARVRSLMLVTSTFQMTPDQAAGWQVRVAAVRAGGVQAVQPALMDRWFRPEAAGSPGYRYMDETFARFRPASFAAMVDAMRGLDTTARLPEIKVPALVVGARDDPGVPPAITERMAALLPKARLEWLDPARHLATLEHPERFNGIAARFLAEVCDI